MSTIKETIAAGAVRSFYDAGDFLRLQSGSGLNLSFFRSGVEIHRSEDVSQGYAAKVPQGFDRIDVGNPTGAAVDVHCFIAADGIEIDYAGQTGAIAVSSMPINSGTATQASAATGADAQILAANVNREYLALQNIGSADIYFTVDGGAADATGFRIGSGQMIVFDSWVPTGAIRAYSASASTLAYCEA